MHSISLLLSTALLGGLAVAQQPQETESKPFYLKIETGAKKSLNGNFIAACHSGAGFETLCINEGKQKFTLNMTQGIDFENEKGHGTPGSLVYGYQTTDLLVSSPMVLQGDPSTNMQVAVFQPDPNNYQGVAFDKNGYMNLPVYLDDTKNPPTSGTPRSFYKWYACESYYGGYTYLSLNWLLGDGKPHNPSCVKVGVKKVAA